MWKSINFNAQNIDYQTAKATLIKMPKKSQYAGFKFWHPSKLIRSNGGNGYFMTFSYTDDFTFKLIKGKKGYEQELEISPLDMEEAFEIVNEQIDCDTAEDDKSYLVVEKPEKINENIEIEKELLN